MESAAAWGPCEEFQLANWSLEDPAAGIPVEYRASSIIDIFDTSSIQAYAPEFYRGQQLVEYNYYAAASQSTTDKSNRVVGPLTAKQSGEANGTPAETSGSPKEIGPTKIPGSAEIKQVVSEFKHHINMTKEKMHRYPACLAGVHESYKVPRVVAIGPYHRGLPDVKNAEKVKHAAACHCAKESVTSLKEMYDKVASVADQVRHLYDKHEMERISYQDFRDMMLFDACFLVQFMRSVLREDKYKIDASLQGFMGPNQIEILRNVLLLDNQIPWQVVETVMSFPSAGGSSPKKVPRMFVSSLRNCLQDDKLGRDKRPHLQWDEDYKPPHLLGLLRHYIVGRSSSSSSNSCSSSSSSNNNDTNDNSKGRDQLQKPKKRSVSAVELAQIGISLTPNKDKMELIHMGLSQGTIFLADLCLTPLSLDRDRGSYLVSMAALELCTVESFGKAREEDTAVCSYLMLLAMLAYRVEDVHELRERGLLQGGGGLSNEDVLSFFTSLQSLRLGKCYNRVMRDVVRYKESKLLVPVYKLIYKNRKTIATVVSIISGLGTIIGMLKSMKAAV